MQTFQLKFQSGLIIILIFSMRMIKQLSQETSEEISAHQVITNINDCIKQLIDNAIDAKATHIKVQLEQYGKKSITVSDNGMGLQNFQFLARKGSTSKNTGNLQEINTLGFRGEALHSLGRLSQSLTIISTAEGQGKSTIKFDAKSQQQQVMTIMRQHGTIVKIEELFTNLRVRRYQLQNRCQQFRKKIDEMIKQYCLIYPQITFIFIDKNGGKQNLLREVKANPICSPNDMEKQWFNRILQVLGSKIGQSLIYMKTQKMQGWLLKNIQSGSGKVNLHIRTDIRYMYLNRRPIELIPKIKSALDACYKKYNKSTKQVYIINLTLPCDNYDINVSPNKRDVFIKEYVKNKIVNELNQFIQKNIIQDLVAYKSYDDQKIDHYLQTNQITQSSMVPEKQQEANAFKENVHCIEKHHQQQYNGLLQKSLKNNRRSKQGCSSNKKKEVLSRPSMDLAQKQQKVSKVTKSKVIQQLNERMTAGIKKNEQKKNKPMTEMKAIDSNTIIKEVEVNQQEKTIKQHLSPSKTFDKRNVDQYYNVISSMSQVKGTKPNESSYENYLSNKEACEKYSLHSQVEQHQPSGSKLQLSGNVNKNLFKKSAQQAYLEKVKPKLPKQALKQFKILGQFNNGFIVCEYLQNMYLVDQHAASQKYNFEKIMKSVRNTAQFEAQINCSIIERQNIQQHRLSLENDGYEFETNEEGVLLKKVPVFLEKMFGKEHFMELVEKSIPLNEHKDFCQAAASRACKKAIKIGVVLQLSQMKNILQQLAELNSPWNCPHGRPTLIYLNSVSKIQGQLMRLNKQHTLE